MPRVVAATPTRGSDMFVAVMGRVLPLAVAMFDVLVSFVGVMFTRAVARRRRGRARCGWYVGSCADRRCGSGLNRDGWGSYLTECRCYPSDH